MITSCPTPAASAWVEGENRRRQKKNGIGCASNVLQSKRDIELLSIFCLIVLTLITSKPHKTQSLCLCKLCETIQYILLLGNNHMKEENYRCAVECYTKAIDLDLRNAVYYCNRYGSVLLQLGRRARSVEPDDAFLCVTCLNTFRQASDKR